MMTESAEPKSDLAAVFDELIDLVHETKQAVWSTGSPAVRRSFEALQDYLAEQAAAIDEAEQNAGGRPAWETEPSAHESRNILGQAGDDPDLVVRILLDDLSRAVRDIRRRSESAEGEWQQLLAGVADGLDERVEALRSP